MRRGAARCGVVWCEAVRRAWTILSSMACWAAGSMPMSAGAITLMMFSTAFATPLPMYAPWAAAGREVETLWDGHGRVRRGASAVLAHLVAITQLQGLVDARARARRHSRTEQTVGRGHVALNSRVAARVEDLQ